MTFYTRPVFIIDIDTTIADNAHRAMLLERHCVACLTPVEYRQACRNCGGTDTNIKQESWDAFLSPERCALDIPVQKAQHAIRRFREEGVEFHFLTGRNEGLREVTEEWLTKYFSYQPERESLIMRGDEHEGTPASVYKEQAFEQLVQTQGYDEPDMPMFFFMEDDPHVFKMYSKYGIVIRCPEGWEHWMPDHATDTEPKFKR